MTSNKSTELESEKRRLALKSLGYAALASGVGFSVAQNTALAKSALTQYKAEVLELKLADPRAIKALNLKRLPKSTPITKMLPKDARAKLTKAARKLTKADLEALAHSKVPKRIGGLTIEDIASVQDAFGGYRPGDLNAISCCCCTPCCCAAAVDEVIAIAC